MPLFRRIQIFEIPRRYIARITTLKFTRASSSPRDAGIRAIWEEAKLNIVTQLRLGIHPVLLQQQLDREHYTHADWHQQDVDYFSSNILANIRRAGQFDDLLSLCEHQRETGDDIWLARYEVKMYEKFGERNLISQFGMDSQLSRKIDRSRELNRDEQDWLAIMKGIKSREIEEKYRANEEILHRYQISEERQRPRRPRFVSTPRRPRSASTTLHNPLTSNNHNDHNDRNDRNNHHSVDVPNGQYRHSFNAQPGRLSRNPSVEMFSDSVLLSETSYEASPSSGQYPRGRRHSMTPNPGLYPSQNQRGRPPISRPHLFDDIDDMVFGDARRFSTPVGEDWRWDDPLENSQW